MDDIMYFQDENGNQVALKLIDTFDCEGNGYALFMTPMDAPDAAEPGIYAMRMTEDENGEMDFAMPDEAEMEKLMPTIMARMDESSVYEGDGGCDCGCHSCGSGCHSCDGECEEK